MHNKHCKGSDNFVKKEKIFSIIIAVRIKCSKFAQNFNKIIIFNLFMSDKNHMTIDDLTKGNIWKVTEAELAHMLVDAKKEEDYEEMEKHYFNIIRTVFDTKIIDRRDESEVKKLESQHYEVYSFPTDGELNAIAIRKHPIKKVTDLTLENIQHLDTLEVLELIKNNMGTGWKGLSLSIQDIIESAFFIDNSTLPASTMHRIGGIIDRRKADGYDVLEIERGNWIEAIFIKAKPKVEKVHIDYRIKDDDEDEDVDEDNDEDMPDVPDDTNDDDDMDDDIDNQTPELEDIDVIEESDIDDDDE